MLVCFMNRPPRWIAAGLAMLLISAPLWSTAAQDGSMRIDPRLMKQFLPQVGYSATRVMGLESQGMQMTGKVFYSPRMERMEMSFGGMTMANITRYDDNVMWQVIDAMKSYREIRMDAAPGAEAGNADVEVEYLGSESLEGRTASKYRFASGPEGGDRVEGNIWLSVEGIPLRVVSDIFSGGQKAGTMTMATKDIVIGPQPAALFEVPAGYSKQTGLIPGINLGSGATTEAPAATVSGGGSDLGTAAGVKVEGIGDSAADTATQSTEENIVEEMREQVDNLFNSLFNN